MNWTTRTTRNFFWRALLSVGLMAVSLYGVAEIKPFPHATLAEKSTVDVDDYRVMMGSVNEIGSVLRVAKEFRIAVTGTQRLFSVQSGYGIDQVAAHYRDQLKQVEAQILYSCIGRDCGSSNVWANQVFERSSLYGRDDQQRYTVAAWRDSSNRRHLMLLYMVERGNRQIHVFQQELKPEEGASIPGAQLAEKRLLGPFIVPFDVKGTEVSLKLSDPVREDILGAAQQYPTARVVLVGHSGLDNVPLTELEQRAEKAAARGAAMLKEAGISEERLKTLSVGPYVPVAEVGRSGARVEVTVVRRSGNE